MQPTTALLDRLGDWINPIAVKEMRQAVKGRVLVWMLIIYLLAQLVIMGAGILFSEFDGGDFEAGAGLLSILLMTLLFVCLLFLPAIFGLRLSAERSQNRIDLLFITDMNPYSIIWGKTLAGMVLTALLFSTSMPFLTLTYLLRGVDMPSIFIMLALNYAIVTLTIQGALLLACFPGGMISRGIRFLMGMGGAIFLLSMVSSASFAILRSGVGSLLGSWDFWGPALTILGFILLGMGFLYVLSAVMIAPNSSNRAPVIRVYLFFVWLCSTVLAALWYFYTREREIAQVWIICMIGFFCVVFILSLTERTISGPRLRRAIPNSLWLRWPAFLIYSGAAGGVIFSLLMLGLSLGVFFASWHYVPQLASSLKTDFHLHTLTFFLYIIAYAFSALFVRRLILPKQESYNSSTIMVMFILLAAGSLFPFLFAWFFVHHDFDKIPDAWYLGNPLIVFLEPRMLETALNLSILWTLIAISLNIPWFAAQIRGFKPLFGSDDSTPVPASAKEESCRI